jgi:methionyl-tRNA formyltransferase
MEMSGRIKIVVFSFGRVGREVVQFIASSHVDHLAKVIVDTEREPNAFGEIGRHVGERCVMSWEQAQTATGVNALRELAADVAVLAWWPHVMKQPLLKNVAHRATLNLHPSFLPHCRGKDPYFWSIVERRPFGVTMHHVTETIDAGDVAFQREIAVGWEDTAETLYRKSEIEMVRLFKECFGRIARGDIPSIPQNLADGSFHMRRELESASIIELERQYTGRQLLNLLRARTFPPHPGCRFVEHGNTYQVRLHISRVN